MSIDYEVSEIQTCEVTEDCAEPAVGLDGWTLYCATHRPGPPVEVPRCPDHRVLMVRMTPAGLESSRWQCPFGDTFCLITSAVLTEDE